MIAAPSNRFTLIEGYRITVQVPTAQAPEVLAAVTEKQSLKYGSYEAVAFTSTNGTQQFRTLPGARNKPTEEICQVTCQEISFHIPKDPAALTIVLEALYRSHPYEEPVIFVAETTSTRHVAGMDDDNPNRFWNRPTLDWVPDVHR